MLFWTTLANGLLVAILFLGRPAGAGDFETCSQLIKVEVAIAACSRAITSGQYTDRELANLYISRAIAGSGEYSRAIQDFGRAVRFDPELAQTDRTDPVEVGEGQFLVCCRAIVYDLRTNTAYRFKDSLGSFASRCLDACTNKLRGATK